MVVVALCSSWMPAWSSVAFVLHDIGRCGLVFLFDAGLVIGYIFLNHLVVVALCPCCMKVLSLDAFFFLITLVVVASRSCWMPAWSLDTFFLNHISCCGLAFLLDEGLVIGYILS